MRVSAHSGSTALRDELMTAEFNSLSWLKPAVGSLAAAHEESRFPHALLITGAEGVGKRTLADRAVAWLLCSDPRPAMQACGQCQECALSQGSGHPDAHFISPLEDKKSIAVDQIRRLIADLTLKPMRAEARVAILTPAESMNEAAQNALLKTLEEPVGITYLILLASNPMRLLPTVRSRCQPLQVAPPDPAVAEAWLREEGPKGVDWAPLLQFVGGAPLAALTLARDGVIEGLAVDELLSDLEEAVTRLTDGRADPASVAERYTNVPLPLILIWVQRLLHQIARAHAGLEAGFGGLRASRFNQLCAGIDLHGLYEYADGVAALRRSEAAPLNRQLILEALFAPWGRGLESRGEPLEV
jgi:DNA polymerase III subunit delta'